MKLTINQRCVTHSGGDLEGSHPIIAAVEIEDVILVLYDYMAFPSEAPARNLFAYKRTGEELWRAKDIGAGATDAYTNFVSEKPLIVGNFSGSNCTIDLQSGAVLHVAVTK